MGFEAMIARAQKKRNAYIDGASCCDANVLNSLK